MARIAESEIERLKADVSLLTLIEQSGLTPIRKYVERLLRLIIGHRINSLQTRIAPEPCQGRRWRDFYRQPLSNALSNTLKLPTKRAELHVEVHSRAEWKAG